MWDLSATARHDGKLPLDTNSTPKLPAPYVDWPSYHPTDPNSAVSADVQQAAPPGRDVIHGDGEVALGGAPVVVEHVLSQRGQRGKMQLVGVLETLAASVGVLGIQVR